MMEHALAMVDSGKRVFYAGIDRSGILLPRSVQERWRATADRPAIVMNTLQPRPPEYRELPPELEDEVADWSLYDDKGPWPF